MKRTFLIVIALVYSFSIFAQVGARPAQSRVETKSIQSKVLNAEREYNIFLPRSYETDVNKKYPILYLLHGMGDTNRGWSGRGHLKDVADQLIASGEMCEMIIVMPNAGGTGDAWNGYFNMPGWSYETFFFTEFLPHIETTYRVIGDKQHRAVAGLSMGGGGSTVYGQRHSDMFIAVYAMSALMNISDGQSRQPAAQNADSKMAHLTKSVQELNCVKYVTDADESRKTQLRSVKWFVDCGDDDFLLDVNIEFTQAMRAAQIPCEFRIRDGGHTWEYWHSALYTCLSFVTRCFFTK